MEEKFKIIKYRSTYGYTNDYSYDLFSKLAENDILNSHYFFLLPIKSIIGIMQSSDIFNGDLSLFKKILNKISKKRSDEAPLVLNICDSHNATINECLSIFSELTCSPICSRLKEIFKSDDNQTTDIFTAIREGKYEMVKYIIEQNPNELEQVDRYKRTPLHYSKIYKHDNIYDLLIKKGLDPNVLDMYMFKASDYHIDKPDNYE